MTLTCLVLTRSCSLDESPSKKKGKFGPVEESAAVDVASMKVSARKRRNNDVRDQSAPVPLSASMKAPPNRKGNGRPRLLLRRMHKVSMKALPKRKGNALGNGTIDDGTGEPQ